jgi:hypothetical protein
MQRDVPAAYGEEGSDQYYRRGAVDPSVDEGERAPRDAQAEQFRTQVHEGHSAEQEYAQPDHQGTVIAFCRLHYFIARSACTFSAALIFSSFKSIFTSAATAFIPSAVVPS